MTTPQPPHTSPTPHVAGETLTDLQEELLDPEQATSVATHLAGCAECRARLDALDDLRVLLRDHAADDGSAPEDVVRRLDDALAAARPPVATASATVTPLPAPGRSPWRTRALQAAAVFVLVAAVGGLGFGAIKAISDRTSSSAGSATSAGSGGAGTEKAARRYTITNSGRDYTQQTLVAALPELLAGTLPPAGKNALTDSQAASPTPATPSTAATRGATPTPDDSQRLRGGAALAACVANLAGGPVTPLAVDLGRFEGKPATIIVLPDPDDPSFVNVYAVAPGCPTGTFLTWQHVALP